MAKGHLEFISIYMDNIKKFVNVTYDDRGRRQFTLKEKAPEAQAPSTSAPKPLAPPIDYSKPLQARTEDIDLISKLGRRKLGVDEDVNKTAPFRCETCDFSVMDSNSWLDHLNSPVHNRMVGNHMKVEKVSVDRVRQRIQMLKSRQKPKEGRGNPTENQGNREELGETEGDTVAKRRKIDDESV